MDLLCTLFQKEISRSWLWEGTVHWEHPTMLKLSTSNRPEQIALHFRHFQFVRINCWVSLATMKVQLSVEDIMVALVSTGKLYSAK